MGFIPALFLMMMITMNMNCKHVFFLPDLMPFLHLSGLHCSGLRLCAWPARGRGLAARAGRKGIHMGGPQGSL